MFSQTDLQCTKAVYICIPVHEVETTFEMEASCKSTGYESHKPHLVQKGFNLNIIWTLEDYLGKISYMFTLLFHFSRELMGARLFVYTQTFWFYIYIPAYRHSLYIYIQMLYRIKKSFHICIEFCMYIDTHKQK